MRMKMETIVIAQRKGGNAKSTSALNLAHAFAEMGKRVLLIDLDDQKNTTSSIAHTDSHGMTIETLLLDDKASVGDIVSLTEWPGVYLIPASGNLSGAIRQLDAEPGSHLALKEKLAACTAAGGDGYDICLIDTSPSLNILVVNALCASDYLFIPLSSKYFSLQGLSQTLEAFTKIKTRLNNNLRVLGMAFVIHDGRSTLANDVVAKAREEYPELVCDAMVGMNIKIEEAQVLRKSILSYAPNDRGARQYRELAAELLLRISMARG
jgi:chromosome partitioning protein